MIMAAKGGMIRDITVGDALELMRISTIECDPRGANGQGPYFYQLLHAMGVFRAGAPSSVRLFSPKYHGQLSPSSSSTGMTWPAVQSGTCSWTTCANASPCSITPRWRRLPAISAGRSGRTWKPATPA